MSQSKYLTPLEALFFMADCLLDEIAEEGLSIKIQEKLKKYNEHKEQYQRTQTQDRVSVLQQRVSL